MSTHCCVCSLAPQNTPIHPQTMPVPIRWATMCTVYTLLTHNSHPYTLTHIHAHTCIHIDTFTCAYTMHTHVNIFTHIHLHSHRCTQSHMLKFTYTQMLISLTHAHICPYSHTSHTLMYTHTYLHTCTYTHTPPKLQQQCTTAATPMVQHHCFTTALCRHLTDHNSRCAGLGLKTGLFSEREQTDTPGSPSSHAHDPQSVQCQFIVLAPQILESLHPSFPC